MFIEEYRTEHSVEMMCRVLDVSRSGYYGWLRRGVSSREHANRELLEHIRTFHRQSRETYGSPRVVRDLHGIGIRCGKNRVARLMRRNGIVAKAGRRFTITTRSRKGAQYAPDRLQRNFVAERPNRYGPRTLPISGRVRDGCTWRWCWTCSRDRSLAGRPARASMLILSARQLTALLVGEVQRKR